MRRCLVCVVLALALTGCQRPWYRRDADRETYAVEGQHQDEQRWPVARTSITPPPGSRLFDPYSPDYPPQPPDDPAAQWFMRHPDGQRPPRTYARDGYAAWIEDPSWRDSLPVDDDGNLLLSPEKAVEVGLLHSREYQQALEDLYATALTLTFNRFEFALHWFGTNNTTFSLFGANETEINTLNTTTNIGFNRNLASGGQLLVDFANNLLFSYAPGGQDALTSNIAVTLMQPLLRGAGRRVRLEGLVQSERDVLYAVRSFARFRKQFYFDLAASGRGSSYLGLLFQVQNIRNLESNLKSTEQNLLLHEALFARGTASTVQVDQAFQKYQQGKLALIQARNSLQTSLDAYKLSLGLPPNLQVKLDDALLEPFQLAAPALEKLQDDADRLFAEYREIDKAPPLASLQSGYRRLIALHRQLAKLTDDVGAELERWRKQPPADTDPPQVKREQATREALEREMPETRKEVIKLGKDIEKEHTGLSDKTRVQDWETIQQRSRQLIAQAAQIYVVQTQIRVYLIQLKPIPTTLDEATTFARENRLDLMNRRAQVVDAWRKIEVTASALKTGLDVKVTANVATPPTGTNPFDFRATASQYTVGLALDAPLNRLAERNAYRASLIAFQQSRRSFMALDDQIQAQIRADIRQLQAEQANFGIARQILIAAARQLEGARDRLLVVPNAADTNGTLDILNALDALLQAKSTLISSWINYESGRAQLLLDMEALRLDERGLPENESNDTPRRADVAEPVEQLPAPRFGPPR